MNEDKTMRKMNPEVRFFQKSKTVWKTNPLSGHSWPEEVKLSGWEVHAGGLTTDFRSEEKAEAFANEMEEFFERNPIMIPRSPREIALLEAEEQRKAVK